MRAERGDRFVRLLRWYPKAWREAHGAVFLDTLREQSEHEDRTSPSRSESFAAMVNGLGTRLDARLAGRMALAGIALATIVQTLTQNLAIGGPVDPVRDGVLLAWFGATAMLVVAGVVSLARTYGLLSGGRAVLALTLGWAALALVSVAEYAWAMGFLQADDNHARTGLATAWVPLSGAAIALGLVPSWMCMEIVLSRTPLGRLPRFGLAALAAAAITYVAGLVVLMQMAWVSVAMGVVALSLRSLGAWPRPESPTVTAGTPTRRLVRVLAGVSAGIGLCGILYAVTASTWSPIAVDETMAGPQGIMILLAGSLPLVAALGLLAAGRGQRALHVWGPLILLSLVIGTVIYAYTYAPDSERMTPALNGGSVALGLAIAWWVSARLGGTRGDRWVAGASIALACVAFHGADVLPLAVFVAPVLAAVLAVRGDLRRQGARVARRSDATAVGG